MPPLLSRYAIKLALLSLLAGTHLGAWMLWRKAHAIPVSLRIIHSHINLMIWGWMGTLAIGFAFWLFPKQGRERPRAWLAWASLLLWGLAHLTQLLAPSESAAATALRAAAALSLGAHLWPRIKAFGR